VLVVIEVNASQNRPKRNKVLRFIYLHLIGYTPSSQSTEPAQRNSGSRARK